MKLKRCWELLWVMGCLGLALGLSSGLAGCGDEGDADENGSPIHAVASVLLVESADVGPEVEVRLMVARESGGSFVFVEELTDVVLDVDGVEGEGFEVSRQRVELRAPESGGDAERTFFYQLLGRSESRLTYGPGRRYTLAFTVNDAAAGEFNGQRFSLTVVSPTQENEISKASEEEVGKKLEIVSANSFSAGIIEVERLDSSDTTFVSFPYNERFLSSAADLMDAVEGGLLGAASGELLTVPDTAFNREGTHAVTYTGLSVEQAGSSRVSANLGRFSMIFSGQAVSLEANPR